MVRMPSDERESKDALSTAYWRWRRGGDVVGGGMVKGDVGQRHLTSVDAAKRTSIKGPTPIPQWLCSNNVRLIRHTVSS
jgi:hypothetical protein